MATKKKAISGKFVAGTYLSLWGGGASDFAYSVEIDRRGGVNTTEAWLLSGKADRDGAGTKATHKSISRKAPAPQLRLRSSILRGYGCERLKRSRTQMRNRSDYETRDLVPYF